VPARTRELKVGPHACFPQKEGGTGGDRGDDWSCFWQLGAGGMAAWALVSTNSGREDGAWVVEEAHGGVHWADANPGESWRSR
jgi:hypothetical protein